MFSSPSYNLDRFQIVDWKNLLRNKNYIFIVSSSADITKFDGILRQFYVNDNDSAAA